MGDRGIDDFPNLVRIILGVTVLGLYVLVSFLF